MSVPAVPDADRAVAEIGSDLHRSLKTHLDHVVREWRTAFAQLERRQQGYVPPGERDDLASLREYTLLAIKALERVGQERSPSLDVQTPAELSWRDVTNEWTRDEAAGRALWEAMRKTARVELRCGKTGAEAIEGYYPRPFERAEFIAVWQALADGLQPRNGLERLLIDGMTQALIMHRQWLHNHVQLESLNAMRVERDIDQYGEWQPPRLSEAGAIDRAALMADRFQRQFLRLLKTYRDQRRLLGTVVVAAGGQLNVGEQQVNMATKPDRASDEV